MALTYLKKYKKEINLKIQNKAIINLANANKQDLNGFLLHRMAYYKDSEYNNTALQECIKEDFIRWTKETWTPVNKDIIQDFRNFLQEYRVFVLKDRGVIKDNIQEQVLNAKEEYKWTLQEIKHQLRTIRKLNLQQNLSNTPQETCSNSITLGTSSFVLYPLPLP